VPRELELKRVRRVESRNWVVVVEGWERERELPGVDGGPV